MFNIDDNVLSAAGYDVTALSDEKKSQYAREMNEELTKRVSERVLAELSERDALEFEDVSSNPDRTRRWLAEFHSDYANREDYQKIREAFGNDDEAMSYYASALWLQYAVPNYGEILQTTIDEYVEEMAAMRQAVNQRLGLV